MRSLKPCEYNPVNTECYRKKTLMQLLSEQE